ncbi:hypothetical protein [Undibacterium sp. SXout20W]|uniref:hypothetical protein n=1 Tax=Undibacterium sp. SXout20W TaxID=3413051 RepID=UPI003BF198F1
MGLSKWVTALAVTGFLVAWWHWADADTVSANDINASLPGKSLFDGKETLQARMLGHDEALPASAAVCLNCHHANRNGNPGSNANVSTDTSFAPLLTKSYLLTSRPRRGGPSSSYQLESFCRVLRDGIDPTDVIVDTVMPRYTLSQQQCAQIWQYLSTQPENS